ncbi:MAG: ABC transporter ATP-binding protein [Clostridia bacterium]|nr:ABC transporter ATP-binding protein [Clostridia bacterium]
MKAFASASPRESSVSDKTGFKVKNLSASYESKLVLSDVSFWVPPAAAGTMVGLLGSNGSGKTTLIKSICSLLPHTGQCLLDNISLKSLSARELSKLISYIPQRSGISISMSVIDVVLQGYNPKLDMFERPTKEMKNAALEALKTVGMETHAEADYLTLSEGEKQLCILARTLIEDTTLLLLDEPDSSLDFHNKYCMMKILTHLVKEYKKTAILCLHDPCLALDFCDQLILLKDGRIFSEIYPKKDSLTSIEAELSQIYGSVTLKRIEDSQHHQRLVLLSAL